MSSSSSSVCGDDPSALNVKADEDILELEKSIKYRGWRVVFASFLLHFAAFGMTYAFGIFILPISHTFGVGRGRGSLDEQPDREHNAWSE